MGKKVSPISLRIGITQKWDSIWYAKNDFKKKFLEDIKIRKFLEKNLKDAAIGKIKILRNAEKIKVEILSAKPGIIVGRGGENIQKLNKKLKEKFGANFDVAVQEIRKPDADANLIAQNIAAQVSRRFPYRRVAKMAVDRAKESGVRGIKIRVAGRLNGVDIARNEIFSFGTIPLHTLRANIDYATAKAPTTYGTIGIKVWVFHGMVFKNKNI